jgi:hypothetical protein
MARGSIQTREWLKQLTYVHFERVTLLCIMFLVGVIAVYAMILATIDLVSDIWVSHSFLEKEALQDTFGHILTIVILLEFNHSIYVADRTGGRHPNAHCCFDRCACGRAQAHASGFRYSRRPGVTRLWRTAPGARRTLLASL